MMLLHVGEIFVAIMKEKTWEKHQIGRGVTLRVLGLGRKPPYYRIKTYFLGIL